MPTAAVFPVRRRLDVCKHLLSFIVVLVLGTTCAAAPPFAEPVVARVEMRLALGEELVDTIEKGDLLTVLEERKDDYVIQTHDGTRGAVEKSNAVRIAESGDIYSELIQLHPKEGRYFTLRASSWWALGMVERALKDFDKAIELGYTAAHAYSSRGLFHAATGNFEAAIEDYNQALKIDPDDTAPLINRAAVYMSTKEFELAVKDYTKAMKGLKDPKSLLHQRAIALKAAGDLDAAAEDFQTIIKLDPRNFAAVMGRGYVRFQQMKHRAAIKDFSTAIRLNPKDAVAWNNRGYNLHQLGLYSEAIDDYDKAIELAPKYALALQNRAWLLATAEDDSVADSASAVASAKQACEVTNYESVGDLSALAAALAADGKFNEAVGWQEKVVELVTDAYKPFAQKLLARYQDERPFAKDPDQANAEEKAASEEQAAAEREAEKRQQANLKRLRQKPRV